MNLWARTTLRQLAVLAVALFFFSCEEETSILGFKNPNKKFQVGYVDIPLNVSSVLSIDSMITDLRPIVSVTTGQTQTVDGILVGEYQDPEFGKINTQSFLSMYATVGTALDATAIYDSISIQLRLNLYGYGFSGSQQNNFNVHEITGDTLTLYNGNRYYASSAAPVFSAEPLGAAGVQVHYDSLLKQVSLPSSQQDTILATGRLDDEFGARVFNAVKAGLATSEANRLFKSQIKGLALVPASTNGVLGFNVVSQAGQMSRVILHYHTLTEGGAVKDTLIRTFGFDFSSYTRIQADRMGTELDALQPYESAEPLSDSRYIQSGAAVITKLDLAPFYVFADSVENVLINSAEVLVDNVEEPSGMRPHQALLLRLMNNSSDQFLNAKVTADRQLMNDSRYFVNVSEPEFYYMAAADASTAATLSYNTEADRYSGSVTLFAQSLLRNKDDSDGTNENRLKYLALVPVSPPVNRSVTRTRFSKDNVKLRIFYTRARTTNP